MAYSRARRPRRQTGLDLSQSSPQMVRVMGGHHQAEEMGQEPDFGEQMYARYNIILSKLISLRVAIKEYVHSTRSKQSYTAEDEGIALSTARKYRPVTPANVRVLLRLATKDVRRLREGYEQWLKSAQPSMTVLGPVESKMTDLEALLAMRMREMEELKRIEMEEDEDVKRPVKSAKKVKEVIPEPEPEPTETTGSIFPPIARTSPSEDDIAPRVHKEIDCQDCDDCRAKQQSKQVSPGPVKIRLRDREPTYLSRQRRSTSLPGPPVNHPFEIRRRESTFLSDTLSSLKFRREKTLVEKRRPFPRQRQVGYPHGSSFPELPPIMSLKRNRTFVVDSERK